MQHRDNTSDDALPDSRVALGYVNAAFAEAELDGIDSDCIVQAALFAAFRHLVQVYGEESAALYAEALPERVRGGSFSTGRRH